MVVFGDIRPLITAVATRREAYWNITLELSSKELFVLPEVLQVDS